MRKVIVAGAEIRTVICPVCGQVEIQTTDESLLCLNCGTVMELKKYDETPKVEKVVSSEQAPRRGRPPKVKVLEEEKKFCRTCSKALVTLGNDFTCKETMDLMNPDAECTIPSKYVSGEPFGDRR